MHILGKLCLAVLFVFGLSACATNPNIVQSQKYVMVDIDPKYLQDCELIPPPDKADYIKSGHDEREDMLTRTLLDQYEAVKKCSNDKKTIRELIETQKKTVDEYNKTEDRRITALGVS